MFVVRILKNGERVGYAWRDDHDALLIGDLSRAPATMPLYEAEEFVDRCESSVFLDYEYEVITYGRLLDELTRTPAPRPSESSTLALRADR